MLQMSIKNLTLLLRSLRIGFMVAVALSLSQVSLAEVVSVSPEAFQQYGKENAFWEVTVNCSIAGENVDRVLQRKTDGSQWCGKEVDSTCDQNKGAAAAKVCGETYTEALNRLNEQRRQEQARADQRKAEQAEVEAQQQAAKRNALQAADRQRALQNTISIEEQRIQIEKEKLRLRRRELELQRRAQELEELLK